MKKKSYLIGFDIGGTFTDFVLLESETGNISIHKCPTTPVDPAQGALEGMHTLLEKSALSIAELALAIHGTTLATNALIERRGAKTALLTTKGFRDILQMGKEQRYDIYDLFLKFPEPLVPRRWRRGISERLDKNGNVIVPLDLEEVRKEVKQLIDQGVESLAVSFLHAYVNPLHERQVASLAKREFPFLKLSLSNEVVAEIREYERTVTTCANAYIKPLMHRYIETLKDSLTAGGFHGRFFLMKSSGGTVSPQDAQHLPIQLMESGPAAGVLAASYFGSLMGRRHLISLDMGGTTAKACLIDDGVPTVTMVQEAARVHRHKKGSGILIKTPTIDLIEIGAGGGSIAKVSPLDLMNVGPKSAGAVPGPACYGRGGDQPTVTDANLILGYLNPDYFLGGKMKLDMQAARRALSRVAKPLNIGVTEAAWGIYSIVNENMVTAARLHIVERGRDPRRYTLVAFGGAGPAHACRVARTLGTPEVVLPFAAGITSALGFLIAPIAFDFAQSYPAVLDKIDWQRLNRIYEEMEKRGRHQLANAGVDHNDMIVSRTADMRMVGQLHEILLPVPNGPLGPGQLGRLKSAFVTEYRRRYSHIFEGNPIMALTWRVRVSGPKPPVRLSMGQSVDDSLPKFRHLILKGRRQAYFPEAGGFIEIDVYDRYALAPGDRIQGPAILEERESTAVIAPGDIATVDQYRNVIICIDEKS
ncbi:MAG: hydantoinase/oxoprolinase family protein [Deltaproteobacteria bacterium]|nr:hydantoinase/oxoprolinase family protein [Deltaproteobacteria bacterium]